MKLIVGLGNPDDKYKKTYHNLGFMCADKTAQILGMEFSKQKCRALIAEKKIGGEKVILAKPQTYMNLSGESVKELISFYKIDLKDIVIIYDDYDINKGVVRIRTSGSAGTHNGMRNVIQLLGDDKFLRIRIGFKPDGENQIPLLNLVLSGIKDEDAPVFEKAISSAAEAAAEFAKGNDVQRIMQRYNGTV